MALYNQMELAAAKEEPPGTAVGGVYAAAYAKHLVIDPQFEYDIPFIEREIKRGSITAYEGRPGTKRARCTFKLEMAGDSSHAAEAVTAPPWGIFMEACGFRQMVTYKLAVSAVASGDPPARHGELIVGSAGGTDPSEAVYVVHDFYPDDSATPTGTLYVASYEDLSSVDSITWTTPATGSNVQFTTSAACTPCGVSWWPVSQNTIEITATSGNTELVAGNIIKMSDNSAAGVVTYASADNNTIHVRLYNGWPNTGGTLDFEEVGDPTDFFDMASATVATLDHPTLSIALNEDGVLQTLSGARGTWTLDATAGELPMMTFEFWGKIVAPADSALLGSAITYQTELPPIFAGAVTRLHEEEDNATASYEEDFYTPRLNSVNLALNNGVNLRPDANDSTGVLTGEITQRRATGTIDPELDLETSFPVLDAWQEGKAIALMFNVGTTTTNMFKISVAGMQFTGGSTADRNGIAARNLQFNCTGGHWENVGGTSVGDNEIVISYLTA